MANKTLKEIAIEYANKFGGGLPLSPEELLNAVVLWVQNYVEGSDGGGGINVDILSTLIEGSDTVVVDINEENTALEIHADYEKIVQPLERAIKTPLANPNVEKIPILQPNGAVEYKARMYKHIIISHPNGAPEDVGYALVIFSTINSIASMTEEGLRNLLSTATSMYHKFGIGSVNNLSLFQHAVYNEGKIYYYSAEYKEFILSDFLNFEIINYTVEEI